MQSSTKREDRMRALARQLFFTVEAKRGRFHFVPLSAIVQLLERAHFSILETRLSYAKQAYLLSTVKAGESCLPD